MKWYWGIPFAVIIILITIFVSRAIGFNLIWLMIIGTALWAAFDSNKIRLKEYKSGLSYGPIVLFIAIGLLWLAGFPWYLHIRYKINHGLAELKEKEL
jgi:hypothetical protein